MGMFSTIAALGVIAAAGLQAAPEASETPAEPRNRNAPEYPVSCRPAPGTEAEPQRVTVNFSVTKDGRTENVRVVESTKPCFDETAIAAARTWTYEPRRVNGAKRPQEDIEVTVTFVWQGDTQTDEYDARPKLRVPPRYPERCAGRADPRERVLLEFDVTVDGRTENTRVIESSRTCFNRSAIVAVSKWRYHPRTVSGKPTDRKNVQTQITFELARKTPPELKFRGVVRSRLKRVERSLRRNNSDPNEILEELAAIEAEFGDTFSRIELRSFHQLRAAARIETGDYKGALDDLHIVKRTGGVEEANQAIADTIAQLEAAIAAQEAVAVPLEEDAAEAEEIGELEN